jgi:hypothetical protein
MTAESQNIDDITTLQTTLIDMQTEISDAVTLAQNINITVSPLLPSGYPDNISDLQSAGQSLKTIKTDIQTAKADAQKIIDALKSLKN